MASLLDRLADLILGPEEQLSEKTITVADIPTFPISNKAKVNTSPERVQNIDTVFACARAIAEPIGIVQKKVVRMKDQEKEFRPKHPVQRLITRAPNTYQNAVSFWHRALYFTVLWGEHFAHIFRDEFGFPVEIHLVPPWLVSDYAWDAETRTLWWRVDPGDGYREPYSFSGWVPSYDMIHCPILSDRVRGRTPIRKFQDDYASAIAAREYGNEFFGNSGKPAVWIETVEPQVDPNANKEFSENMRTQFRHGNMLLPYGRKLHSLSMPPNDSQFLETKMFNVETLCRIYNVPPPVVQHFKDGANYSNLETLTRNYATVTLLPYTGNIETEYSLKLFTQGELDRGYMVDVDFSSLLKADPKTRAEVAAKYVQNGIRTVDEIRGVDGYGTVVNGNRPVMQQNMAFLDSLDELYQNKYGRSNQNNSTNDNGQSSDPEAGVEVSVSEDEN